MVKARSYLFFCNIVFIYSIPSTMIGDCSLEDILMILVFGIFTKISMNKIKEDEDEA